MGFVSVSKRVQVSGHDYANRGEKKEEKRRGGDATEEGGSGPFGEAIRRRTGNRNELRNKSLQKGCRARS